MHELTVYTCVTGGFDKHEPLLEAKPVVGSTKFVAYLGGAKKKEQRGIWEIRPCEWRHPTSPRRTSRWHKMHPHILLPDAVWTMWIDGSQEFKEGVNPLQVLRELVFGHDIATFKHPLRTCVYQEMRTCRKLRKDNGPVMRRQIRGYRDEGYPEFNGMVETACVVRRNVLPVSNFNNAWWSEIENGSLRDQLSFNYVAWKLGMSYGHVRGHRAESDYFIFHNHKRR